MLNRKRLVVVSLIGGTALAACTAVNPQDRGAVGTSGLKSADARRVIMAGCVGTGPGSQQYHLTQVRLPPLAQQPIDALSSTGLSMTDRSQVRLSMEDDQQLRKLLGQIVEIDGAIGDEGRILVQRISPTGQACQKETKN